MWHVPHLKRVPERRKSKAQKNPPPEMPLRHSKKDKFSGLAEIITPFNYCNLSLPKRYNYIGVNRDGL
jgi:hypothetical protein